MIRLRQAKRWHSKLRRELRQMVHFGHYIRIGLDIFTGREPTEDTKAYLEDLRRRQ